MSWPGTAFLPPTERARRWVEKVVGPGSKLVRVRRMGGGTSSAVHSVDVRLSSGSLLRLVLRRHLQFDWLQEEPDLAEKEARNLQLLEQVGITAPRLVAVDPDGAECDVPAVLMTHMPGHLDLKPRDLESWLRRMAELLPPIHAIKPGPVRVQGWEIWDDLRKQSPPAWSARKPEWKRLIAIVRGPWPEYKPRFVHRDFQHYNVLWSRGRPTCLVDWINASMGPVELDFGHFRYNLLADFGFEVAERFLVHYRQVTGEEPHPFWEALNFVPAPPETEEEKVNFDTYVVSLLAKLS
ncbi:MAG TPA: aminoglycoside phosphotransferase family protein [Candidatus Dormibacteraeota bacterium]